MHEDVVFEELLLDVVNGEQADLAFALAQAEDRLFASCSASDAQFLLAVFVLFESSKVGFVGLVFAGKFDKIGGHGFS